MSAQRSAPSTGNAESAENNGRAVHDQSTEGRDSPAAIAETVARMLDASAADPVRADQAIAGLAARYLKCGDNAGAQHVIDILAAHTDYARAAAVRDGAVQLAGGATATAEQYAAYLERLTLEEFYRLKARTEAKRRLNVEEQTEEDAGAGLADGAAFIFDQPDRVPARWGEAEEILWAKGEALMLCGPPGVGKTTLTGQVVRALLGLQPDVLSYPVEPVGRVLYLAMDRPRQIGRALARHFTPADRDTVAERLTVWQGPPPADLAADPHALLDLARRVGADVVVVDSLKDAAVGLSEDAVGAGYNRARQRVLAAGIDLLELHHQKKAGANGGKPDKLADVYGSTWLTSGAGSVIGLWGDAGDPIVELSHLKPVMEPIGPFNVVHDHIRGISTIDGAVDVVALAAATPRGTTVGIVAEAMFGEKPTPAQRMKARRRVEKLVGLGLLVEAEKIDGGKGHNIGTFKPGPNTGRPPGRGLFG